MGSKSLATFTPSRAHGSSFKCAGISAADAGRSRTWPILASTRNSRELRNVRIVRAFVGDSTTTSRLILLHVNIIHGLLLRPGYSGKRRDAGNNRRRRPVRKIGLYAVNDKTEDKTRSEGFRHRT